MKVLVLASCLLAVASAGFLPAAYHGLGRVGVFDQNGYKIDDAPAAVAAPFAVAAPVAYAAHHVPVVGPNGVPLDTPAVAAAKASHAAAHVEATARNAVANGVAVVAPVAAGVVAPVAYTAGYAGPQHIPVIGPNGVPVETPEVVAAKANHAAAHVEATARNAAADGVAVVAPYAAGLVGPVAYAAGFAAPQHIPVIGPNGVPVETPAVVAAKASHAAAHVEATARNAAADGVAVVAPGVFAHGYAAPVIANGVPVDTPAVAAARAAHYAAHIDAKVRAGILHPAVHYRKRRGIFHGVHHAAGVAVAGAPVVAAGRAAVYDQNGYQIDEAPVAVATPYGVAAPFAAVAPVAYAAHYAGPQHLPVIGANGVPVETPEVVAAKASHAAAHVEATARNAAADSVAVVAGAAPVAYAGFAGQHLPVIGPNGVPLETPAVVAAKASHAAAHVDAVARNAAADAADSVAVVAPFAGVAGVGPVAYSTYFAGHHVPAIGPNGVPLDTPAVAAAKVSHAVAHVEAKARNGDLAVVAPFTTYAATPVVAGVPVDTPAVAHAKAAHFAAHLDAKVRAGILHPVY